MTEIPTTARDWFGYFDMNRDAIIDAMFKLPARPYRRFTGSGFARVNFPSRKTLDLRWLWAAIPAAHKDEQAGVISPEAFDIIKEHLL
jgi:hypothetical protein